MAIPAFAFTSPIRKAHNSGLDKSTKVILFSLLIFPGAGQLLVRKWGWAMLFISSTILSIAFVVTFAYKRARTIMDNIITGEIAPDLKAILVHIYERPSGDEARMLAFAHLLLLACWLGGVAHAWLSTKEAT